MRKLFITILVSFQFILEAQVITPFTVRKTITQKGGILFLANSSSRANPINVVQNQLAPAGTGYNNSFTNAYIDIDTDPTTFMSSSDSLALPVCSEISWVGLYWGADCSTGDENFATRNQVKLKVNNGSYANLTADYLKDNTIGYKTYHCFKDITSIFLANGLNARYTVANVATDVAGTNLFGGWTIVVVFKNNTQTMRNLTVFDGLANVSSAASIVDIPISGFQTPLTGPVNFELGMVVFDGDRSLTGDQLMFKGGSAFINISDALHPASDLFNSTIANKGVMTAFRNPNYNNTLGFDANIFAPNNSTKNYIGNNAISATIRQTTGGETFLTQVVTSAIDVYEPDLRSAVRVQNLSNPGANIANPGDTLEYTVSGLNIGSDPSVNTFITDTLEGNMTYIPNSTVITFGPNSGAKSDASGDDQVDYISSSKVVRVRIGAGANGFQGGQVNNSPSGTDSTIFKFKVKVSEDCIYLACDNVINNKANIIGTGNVSGNEFNNKSNPGIFDGNGCAISGSTATPISMGSCSDSPAATVATPICAGSTINFTASFSPSARYEWTGPNNFSSTLRQPTIPNASSSNLGEYIGNIYILGTDCHFEFPINVNFAIANAGVDQVGTATCGLTSIPIQGNLPAGSTGSWSIISGTGGSFGAGNTSTSTSASTTFNGVSGNTYTLRWSLSNPGCGPSSDDVVITLLRAPSSATLTGTNVTCASRLNVAITGGVSPYTVEINSGIGTITDYVSGTNIPVNPAATTSYSLISITGANGCKITTNFTGNPSITGSASIGAGTITINNPLTVTTANSGSRFPTTGVTSGGSGSAWSNPSDAYSNNSNYASNDVTGNGSLSEFLYLRGFGFSIPSNAVVDGIIVQIDKKAEIINAIKDNVIQLINNTTNLGVNRAVTASFWPTSDITTTYGSTSDMWGNTSLTLTPAIINNANFGLQIKVINSNSSTSKRNAYIDYASITVHYHIGNNAYCDTMSSMGFTASGFTNATSYNWTAPTGARIRSGQGTANVTVDFNGAGQSGNVSMLCTPRNACGDGTAASIIFAMQDCPNPSPLCMTGYVYWDYNGNNKVDGVPLSIAKGSQLYVTLNRTSTSTGSFITTPVNTDGTWKACHANITSNTALRATISTTNYTNNTAIGSVLSTFPSGVTVIGEINNDLSNSLTGNIGTIRNIAAGTDTTINGQLNFTTPSSMSNTDMNLNFSLKINTNPTANANTITTNEDVPVSVNVATNDVDTDGTINAASVDLDTLTAGTQTSVTDANGTWTVNASGIVTFTPLSNYFGTAIRFYNIKDNDGLTSNATSLIITVRAVNDAPVALASAITMDENGTYNFKSSDFNYSDVENNTPLSITIFTLPAKGSLKLNGVPVTAGQIILMSNIRNLSYAPLPNEYGSTYAPFQFKVNDSTNGTQAATMNINITHVVSPPIITNDNLTTNQNTPLSMNILTNDVNIDGTINANSVDLDPNTPGQQTTLVVPGQGTYTVNSSGVLTFTPLSTFYGNTTPIQYTVTNSLGLVSNPGNISFTVVPAGAPFAANDIISTIQNNSATYNITANDTDDVSINVSRIDFDPVATGFQQSYYVASKGQFSADASGFMTFTPDWNFSGTVTAQYTIRDNMNLVSNIATIQVQVQWVNTPPFAVDDAIEMNEDGSVTFNALTNDYDIDGRILANSVDLNPRVAGVQTTRTVSGEGTYTVNNSGIVTFTPVANFNGFVTPIGYTIKDSLNVVSDSAVFIINVLSINDAPVAANDTVYGPGTQGTNSISFNILTNDNDIDGTLDASSIDLDPVANGIQKTYTVSGEGTYTVDSLGEVTFSYSFNTPTGGCTPINYVVYDNEGAPSLSSKILVDILDLGVPTAIDDILYMYKNYPTSFDPTLNDIDNGSGIDATLTALIGSLSTANGTWSITKNVVDTPDFVRFVPANNFIGNVTIFYTIKNNDSVVSNQAKITLTVRDLPSPTISNSNIYSNSTTMLYGLVNGNSDSVVLFKNGIRIGVITVVNGQWVMSGIDSSIFNTGDQITARNYIEGFASDPSNAITVEPILTKFLIKSETGGNIGNQVAGIPFNVDIYAADPANTTIVTYTGTNNLTATYTISSGAGPTSNFINGFLNNHSLTLNKAGTYTLNTYSNQDTSIKGTSNSFVVAPNNSYKLVLTRPSSDTTLYLQDFAIQPIVSITDIYGNVQESDNTSTVTASIISSGIGTLVGSVTKTVVNGVATFTNLSVDYPGDVIIKFTSSNSSLNTVNDSMYIKGYTWYGLFSDDFNTAGNWLENAVPFPGAHIEFHPTPVNHCVMDQNRTIGNIKNGSNKYLDLNTFVLTLEGKLLFTNNAVIKGNVGTSKMILKASSIQTIANPTFVDKTINYLQMENPAGVTLEGTNNELIIGNNLNFVVGKFTSAGTGNLITFMDNANYTGADSNKFIIGRCKKIGNDAFAFPIGKGSKYAPCEISAPLQITDAFIAEYFSVSHHKNNKKNQNNTYGKSLNKKSNKEYWNIDRIFGNSSVDVALYWYDASFSEITNTNVLTVAHFDSTGDAWEIPSNNGAIVPSVNTFNANSGKVTFPQVSTFSPFTFGETNPVVGLPVELVHFQATCQSDYIQIDWTTASEIRNKAFELYKSDNAQDWKFIHTEAGQGDKATETIYAFKDLDKKTGYYRLKDIDEDGIENWSQIIFSDCKNDVSDIQVYPNPASDYIKVIAPISENTTLNILSLEGKIIKTMPLISNQTMVSVKDLVSGIYMIEINGKTSSKTIKIIKK
jgi:CshA-type fibril repeat protein